MISSFNPSTLHSHLANTQPSFQYILNNRYKCGPSTNVCLFSPLTTSIYFEHLQSVRHCDRNSCGKMSICSYSLPLPHTKKPISSCIPLTVSDIPIGSVTHTRESGVIPACFLSPTPQPICNQSPA